MFKCKWWKSYWIMNNVVIDNSIESKLKYRGKLGCTLNIVEKTSMNKTLWRWFCNLETQGLKDIEFWVIFVIWNSTKLQNMVFGKRNQLGNEFTFGPTT
jgi:hypothetical protein